MMTGATALILLCDKIKDESQRFRDIHYGLPYIYTYIGWNIRARFLFLSELLLYLLRPPIGFGERGRDARQKCSRAVLGTEIDSS